MLEPTGLFAEGGLDLNAWGTFIAMVIGAVVSGGVVKIWPLLMQSREQRAKIKSEALKQKVDIRRTTRAEAIQELKDIVDNLQAKTTRQDTKIEKDQATIERLLEQVKDLVEGHADCLIKNGELANRVQVLEEDKRQRETRVALCESESIAAASIVADQAGTIEEWNTEATLLLHWSAREAIGAHVETLVPPQLLARFRRAWDEMLRGERQVRRGPFKFDAMTRDKGRRPVELLLSSWTIGEGQGKRRKFGATIQARPQDRDGRTADDTLDLGACEAQPVGGSGVLRDQILAERIALKKEAKGEEP